MRQLLTMGQQMDQDIPFSAAEVQRTKAFVDHLPGRADHVVSVQPDVANVYNESHMAWATVNAVGPQPWATKVTIIAKKQN